MYASASGTEHSCLPFTEFPRMLPLEGKGLREKAKRGKWGACYTGKSVIVVHLLLQVENALGL